MHFLIPDQKFLTMGIMGILRLNTHLLRLTRDKQESFLTLSILSLAAVLCK